VTEIGQRVLQEAKDLEGILYEFWVGGFQRQTAKQGSTLGRGKHERSFQVLCCTICSCRFGTMDAHRTNVLNYRDKAEHYVQKRNMSLL